MDLADALLGNHRQLDLLVLAEHHEPDGVLLVPLIVLVHDRYDA